MLQYVASVREKESRYDELLAKVQILELSLRHKEEALKDKQIQIEMLMEQYKAYKENEAIKAELIYEKNNKILELETRIKQNELYKKIELLELANNTQIKENNNEVLKKSNDETTVKSNLMEVEENRHKLQKLVENPQTNFPIDNYLSVDCLGKRYNVYLLKMIGIDRFSSVCDPSVSVSGWTVVQRRRDGSENFNRNWDDYRAGFGDLHGDFFLGLENLHRLTKTSDHELYIHMEDFQNETRYAYYKHFKIGDESQAYQIADLGEYSGDAGDSLSSHKQIAFSTPDRSTDGCAQIFKSGWWFNSNCYIW